MESENVLQKLSGDLNLRFLNRQEAQEKLMKKLREVGKCKDFEEVESIEEEIRCNKRFLL